MDDTELNKIPPESEPKLCRCGNVATCDGAYEGIPSCHGNEDGWCEPIARCLTEES